MLKIIFLPCDMTTDTGKDLAKEYSVIAQLFRLLVREDIFDSIERQTVVVRHILREVYKTDKETAEKVAYPAMRIALGVTALLSDTKPQTKKNRDKEINPETGEPLPEKPVKPLRLPPKLITQCLRDIFAYLLVEAPIAFVVEHAHYADQPSWDVIYSLSGIPSLALGVITMDTIEVWAIYFISYPHTIQYLLPRPFIQNIYSDKLQIKSMYYTI